MSQSVGQIVKIMRLEKAWSQEQLADMSGISVRTIQRLEQGQPASLETVKALAACFGVPAALFSARSLQPPSDADMTQSTPALSAAQTAPGLKYNLAIYGLVMALLTAINLTTSPEHLWVIYPAGGWGLALGIKALRRYFPD